MSTVNINTLNSTISVQDINQEISVTDNNKNTTVSIPQTNTNIVQVNAIGPQGPVGPRGETGPTPNTGSFATTGSNVFYGNQIITGSIYVSGTLQGTSSYAINADLLDGKDSTIFATTGSNAFVGDQSITNGNILLGGTVLNGVINSISIGYINTSANNEGSFAHGEASVTNGFNSYAQGNSVTANGDYSHAEGAFTTANGDYSHAEGQSTIADADYSHAEGIGTIATSVGQTVMGKYNIQDNTALVVIGNGTDDSNRSNIVLVNNNNVIVSSSLNVIQGITGSLQGTASFATQTISSSFASTASFVNRLNQSVVISGSLLISGSLTTDDGVNVQTITASFISASSGITGSLFGTATTASYVLNAVSSSFASTASLAPNYVLTSVTSSMLAPYMLIANTSSMLQPYVLTNITSSMLAPYVLTNVTSSMLAPYVLNSATSSFVTTSSFNSFTSSFNNVTSSFATTGSNIFVGIQTITGSGNIIIKSSATGSLSGSVSIGLGPFDGVTSGFFSGNTLGTSLAINEISSYAGDFLRLQRGGADRFRVDYGGNLYFGAAGANVSVSSILSELTGLTSNAGSLKFGASSDGRNYIQIFGSTNATPSLIQFITSGSEVMRITGSGNVGIGLTNSTARLHVRGGGSASFPSIQVEDNTGVTKFRVASNTSAPELLLSTIGNININSKFQSLAQNAIEITNQGLTLSNITNANQGVIGISGFTFAPGAGSGSFRPLNIDYAINASGTQVGSVTGILVNAIETSLSGSTHNLIDLQISGSSRFKVNNSGSVGINLGTNIPSGLLHVRGTTSGSNTTLRVENVNASASLTLDDVGTLVTPGRLFFGGNTAGFAWNVNGSATIQTAYGNESGQIELRPNGSSAGIVFSRNGNMGLGSPTFKFFSTPWTIFASGSVIVGDYGGFTNNTAAPAKFAISGSGAQTLVKIDSTTVSNILNISSSGLIVSTGSFNIRGDINLSTGSLTLTTGSVTMPNRSAFRVYGASLTGIPATTTISGSATTVDYNQGNNYNNTTGLYTAPVAGLYSVYYNGRTQSGATQQVIVYKNRVAGVGGTSMLMWETTGSNSGHFGVSSILNLAANDTLQAVVALGTIQFDSNDNWGAAFIG